MTRALAAAAFLLAAVAAPAHAVCVDGAGVCAYTQGTNGCVYEEDPDGNWIEYCAGTSGLKMCSENADGLRCSWVG